MNVLLDRGPDLDDEFWDGLEETLILADIGGRGSQRDRGEPARPGHATRRFPMPTRCSTC